MTKAKSGDTVRIHYTGSFPGGETFDSSRDREPLEFTIGSGQIISGLDREIEGMEVGETKTVEVAAADAYGEPMAEQIQAAPKEMFPPDIPLEVGLQLQVRTGDGREIPVVVREIRENEVILDANHPLAGKDLVFEVELVEIV
ncbi:MAG: peptidylprolyl isomerase [Alphaproteobacteria bacterium]|nr:MAG: peptidylprolyl isomerase [Alphaproteobacteria bacterium]